MLKNHPIKAIIGDIIEGRNSKGKRNVGYCEMAGMISIYTSTIEPKNIKEAINNEYWIEAM